MASLNTSKVDGNTVSASEWNQFASINNFITNSGQTPSTSNLQQMGIASARYASAGQHFEDSSASANTYILSPVSPFRSPVSSTAGEGYFIGMRITFKTANANSGASTVNVNSLGAKSLKKSDGTTDVTTGDIPAGQYVTFIYNGTHFVKQNQTPATSTAQGILALTPNKIITLSNNATDATNDIDATAGWFNFDDGSGQAYYSGGTGQLDIVFGTNNGMLDTGAIANTTYHLFLIYNPTTLVSKILASTSVSSPTMPSGYTKKARIGSIIRASGAILAFEQFDKKFILGGTKIVDRAIAAPPTTASNQTVTAPAGISTRAVSLIECEPNSATGNTFLIIEPTTHTSTTPTSTNHTLFVWHQSGGPNSLSAQIETKTNTSSQILINANISTSHNLRIIAVGWIDYQLNY